ncbi:centriole, cilia and spindle-associated protein [Terrapene carolina triunguis]|uniref:Centriole, cilia and spindle associated protein n=1 Tax=Terrapene triunguis TaxID=2587831 RepID=A0A674K9H1_9SAUR|nr:centriole, cilia and spindle-associated protein [Terrapene carolina triunguis]
MVPARPRVKSEYMKRFKEPKWESCGPCYQELLHYRLSRRLLEQAHRPWLWDGWEPGSSGSSAGSPSPPSASPPAAQQQEAAAPSAPGPGGSSRVGELGAAGKASPAEPLRAAEKETEGDSQEKVAEQTLVKETDKSTSHTGQHPNRSALSSRNARRSAKSPQRTDAAKEHKHPFALYGWGEKHTDTGSQKTHNVCASASVHEIHESALRAKNRRQVEKRKLSQKRVRSADVDRTWRVKPSLPDNPWMTEYMRCYSARAR